MQALQRMQGDLTIVIIAHREKTLAYCDDVIQIEGGVLHKHRQPYHVVADQK